MAVAFKDYYKILGVQKRADAKAIKQAFRRLARKHHPDMNPGNKAAVERFKEINEAYEVLSDPEKRQRYDTLGPDWQRAAQGPPGGGDFGGFRVHVEPGADAGEVWGEATLQVRLGKGAAVTEHAQAPLPVPHQRRARGGVTRAADQRQGDGVTHHLVGRDPSPSRRGRHQRRDTGIGCPHPNTPSVIVSNQASA